MQESAGISETLEAQRPQESLGVGVRVAPSQSERIESTSLRHSSLGVCVLGRGFPSTLASRTEYRPLSAPCDYSEASPPGICCRNKS